MEFPLAIHLPFFLFGRGGNFQPSQQVFGGIPFPIHMRCISKEGGIFYRSSKVFGGNPLAIICVVFLCRQLVPAVPEVLTGVPSGNPIAILSLWEGGGHF